MAKGPFKLKSGNSPLFKNMGSSPVRQEGPASKKGPGFVEHKYLKGHHWDKDKDLLYKYGTKPLIDFTKWAGETAVQSFSSPEAIIETMGFRGLPVMKGLGYLKGRGKEMISKIKDVF